MARYPGPDFWRAELGMRDDHERRRPRDHALERPLERLGIQRSEALVEHHHLSALQERARHVEPALLPVRQLPPCLAHHLLEAPRHPAEEIPEAELAADRLGVREVSSRRRPPP